jgi:beta-phosphoglucomutase-like phosphatase (HAD superfamily)
MSSNMIKEGDAKSENFLVENYKGLIFDCDGTLINSMEYYYNGWIPLYQKHGLKFPRERFYALAGVPVRKIIEIVLEENNKTVDAILIDSILEEKKLINSNRRANGEAPTEITCVTKIVKELYGKLPIAVASSGQKFLVQEDLKNHDLLKYFDAVVTVEDVAKGKPAPDLYLEACKRINVCPEHCIGYEDAVLGIESLYAANMDAVNVTEFKGYPH